MLAGAGLRRRRLRLGVLDVAAPFRVAHILRAVLLGRLLEQEGGAALGAGLGDRFLPQRELAVREAAARPERLAAAGALLHHLALAALGAGDAGRLGLR